MMDVCANFKENTSRYEVMRYPVQENPPEKEKCPQPWLSAVQRHNDAKLRMLHIQYSSRIDTHLINIVILRHIKMTLQLCEAF